MQIYRMNFLNGKLLHSDRNVNPQEFPIESISANNACKFEQLSEPGSDKLMLHFPISFPVFSESHLDQVFMEISADGNAMRVFWIVSYLACRTANWKLYVRNKRRCSWCFLRVRSKRYDSAFVGYFQSVISFHPPSRARRPCC